MDNLPFSRWFAGRYPKIARSIADGTEGPNERWLFTYSKEAFNAGVEYGHTPADEISTENSEIKEIYPSRVGDS